nr:hypothetical protein [Tanacetum cinerariifolium]
MFTFLVVGWKSVAHDSRILSEAIRNQNAPFPLPPLDKYYLCDAAYAHTRVYGTISQCEILVRRFSAKASIGWMTPFSLTTQRNITITCFALHNFICKEGLDDELFSTCDQLNVQLDNENVLVEDNGGVEEDQPTAAVNAAKAKAKHKAVKGKRVNVVKALTCWGNLQENLHDKGVIDSGCSRHMIKNMSFLTDYEEIDGGYVNFGGNPK